MKRKNCLDDHEPLSSRVLFYRGIILGIESAVSMFRDCKMFLDQNMELGQAIEWHGRVGMMLCMVGHVPCQHANQCVGESGATVFQHVGHIGTSAMFSEKVKTQERLADKCWYDPNPEHNAIS